VNPLQVRTRTYIEDETLRTTRESEVEVHHQEEHQPALEKFRQKSQSELYATYCQLFLFLNNGSNIRIISKKLY